MTPGMAVTGFDQNGKTMSGAGILCLTEPHRAVPLKWFSIVDEFTRECLALKVDRSIRSEDVIDTLGRTVFF